MTVNPSSPDRSGTFGRRSGPDAPRPVPFKKEMLPGVTFVEACEQIGQSVLARVKRADDPTLFAAIRQDSNSAREAAAVAAVARIADGSLTVGNPDRIIVRGAKLGAYTQRETAAAIIAALTFLRAENPPQRVRYCERIGGETDRALALGRAGENPIGWTDGHLTESSPSVKRASEAEIAAARERRDARSGVNAPTAVYRSRSAAAQERERAEQERAERAASSARKRAAKEAARGASETGADSDAASPARRPRRPRKEV